MPPTTRSSGKPPPSRIYNTTPTLHQVQFPARRKVVKTYSKRTSTSAAKSNPSEDVVFAEPSASNPTSSRRSTKKYDARLDPKQKTLTQIDGWSSSFSERPDVEFSDSDEEKEKENDDPEEEEEEEPRSSATKRKRAPRKDDQGKRRRTLGDQSGNEKGRQKQSKGTSRRKTLGDAPSASAYHTQTLTQFVGRNAMLIRDSEDEDEGGFDEWLREADSPTVRAKNHAPEQGSPSKPRSLAPQVVNPSTPAKNKTEQSIWEVPSSSQSGTPLSNRMLLRYGAPNSNKDSPSKGTQEKEVITEAKGKAPTMVKAPSLVIQDSYSTASWESLPKATPSNKTPSKGSPLKDITEEVVRGNDETPSKRAALRASQRSSQRKRKHVKTGKENETPTKKASLQHSRGTPTPTKRSPRKLSSGKFEIPDSDEDEGGFTESEGEEAEESDQQEPRKAVQEQPQESIQEEAQDPNQRESKQPLEHELQQPVPPEFEEAVQEEHQELIPEEPPRTALPEAAETQIVLGDPDDILDIQDSLLPGYNPEIDDDMTALPFTHADEQFTHLDKTPGAASVRFELPYSTAPESEEHLTHFTKTQQDDQTTASIRFQLPSSTGTEHEEQSTHMSKTQNSTNVIDYGFNSSASTSTKRDQASYIDKTQQENSVRGVLPPSSGIRGEQFTHIDRTQQQDSVQVMLPTFSAQPSEQFTHMSRNQQDSEVTVNYDFEPFPAASQASTQEDEEEFTHIDRSLQDLVTPRAYVRFKSTPAFIPTPADLSPTATDEGVTATQESGVDAPFATAKEAVAETAEPEPFKAFEPERTTKSKPEVVTIDDEENYAGIETQGIWKEIESSNEDPFQSGSSSRQRTNSAETPHTSPQLPTPKPKHMVSTPKKTKPLRKPLRHLPPSSQTQLLESQRLPLSIIQAMGATTTRTDIVLPVHSSSLAPLVSGHTLHLSLPYKTPLQVQRFWLLENGKLVQYGVNAEHEVEDVTEAGLKTWRYFVSQVFELNNPMTREELLYEGFITNKPDRFHYLDPAPVQRLLANLRHALFSANGEDEAETQLTEIEEEDEPTQPDEHPDEPSGKAPRKQPLNLGSSFSISQAAEAQLLSEQATHTDEILCPSTPLKERPSAPPATNPIPKDTTSYLPSDLSDSATRRGFVRPSQATTASQASTPEKASQYLPAPTLALTPTRRRAQPATTTTTRRTMPPPESSSSHLTFPESQNSPPFLIPLSQHGGLRSSQLLTKSQMLPDSLVRDDGGWDGLG